MGMVNANEISRKQIKENKQDEKQESDDSCFYYSKVIMLLI